MENKRGSWKQIGGTGSWVDTELATIAGNEIISIDKLGDLYATNPQSQKSRKVNNDKYTHSHFLFGAGDEIYCIDKDGSFYITNAKDGSYKRAGEFATYAHTVAATMAGVNLITVGESGSCYVTEPSGEWKKISEDNFSKVKFYFAGEKYFFIIENNTLYQVNPLTGGYKKLANDGDFANSTIGAGMNDNVFVLENTGLIWEVDGETGKYKKLSDETFLNTRMMFAGNNCIYTIEPTGCLYEIYI